MGFASFSRHQQTTKCHFVEAYDMLLLSYLLQACGLTKKRENSIFPGERMVEISKWNFRIDKLYLEKKFNRQSINGIALNIYSL